MMSIAATTIITIATIFQVDVPPPPGVAVVASGVVTVQPVGRSLVLSVKGIPVTSVVTSSVTLGFDVGSVTLGLVVGSVTLVFDVVSVTSNGEVVSCPSVIVTLPVTGDCADIPAK